MVDLVDFSKMNQNFIESMANLFSLQIIAHTHFNEYFQWRITSRKIERKTHTNIVYIDIATMKKPSYQTKARFKVEYSDLIDEAIKTTHN